MVMAVASTALVAFDAPIWYTQASTSIGSELAAQSNGILIPSPGGSCGAGWARSITKIANGPVDNVRPA